MRLTKQSNYALRTLIYCAARESRLSTINEIAGAYKISEFFLTKIVAKLTGAGFLESVRGRAGGIRLARKTDTISLLEVVKLVENNFEMADCFRSGPSDCPLIDHCKLRRVLAEALDKFFSVLDAYTISDLVTEAPVARLLGIQTQADEKMA